MPYQHQMYAGMAILLYGKHRKSSTSYLFMTIDNKLLL